MAFHEIRFPANLSFGSVGGPERRTEIVTLANGFEERNTPWAHSRRRYDAGVGLRSLNDVETLIAFFEARAGQLHGFRWKDWSDFKSCAPLATPAPDDQLIGTGDGETKVFPLRKTYVSGLQDYSRPIRKPVLGTVVIAVAGDQKIESQEFTVNTETGEVTFTLAPDLGTRVTAGFEFDVPVRFDTDALDVTLDLERLGSITSIPLLELRR